MQLALSLFIVNRFAVQGRPYDGVPGVFGGIEGGLLGRPCGTNEGGSPGDWARGDRWRDS